MVRVLPDVPALDRELDYVVGPSLGAIPPIGTVVRVPLHGRRVRGWITGSGSPDDVARPLEAVARVSGMGPDAEVIELCRWVAWRWAGRLATVMRVATPDRVVASPSSAPPRPPEVGRPDIPAPDPLVAELLGDPAPDPAGGPPPVHLVEVGPTEDPLPAALAAAALGQVLFVAPSIRTQRRVASGLAAAGATVASWPWDFAGAAGGHCVVGGRAAVFAPAPRLAAVVVWDEHDEGLQNESSPTWHAREVAVERARRAGVPCVLVSPCPSLEGLGAVSATGGEHRRAPSARRRQGWAPLVVVDRRGDDMARTGLFSETFVAEARRSRAAGDRVVCVLNRVGRARLVACRSCGTLATCEACGAASRMATATRFTCDRCPEERPVVCLACGSGSIRLLRLGVTRAREELEALLREPVAEVSAAAARQRGGSGDPPPEVGVLVGTEAVLHRVRRAGLVAFLDLDQELLAARYRAAEEALALLVLGSRAVGGRREGARVLVQTRMPDHEVLRAAARGAPDVVAAAEAPRREVLGMPPAGAVAAIGGEAAEEFVELLGRPLGIDVRGPRDGWWLVQADSLTALADALATVRRPSGRLRLRVDPVRLPS